MSKLACFCLSSIGGALVATALQHPPESAWVFVAVSGFLMVIFGFVAEAFA